MRKPALSYYLFRRLPSSWGGQQQASTSIQHALVGHQSLQYNVWNDNVGQHHCHRKHQSSQCKSLPVMFRSIPHLSVEEQCNMSIIPLWRLHRLLPAEFKASAAKASWSWSSYLQSISSQIRLFQQHRLTIRCFSCILQESTKKRGLPSESASVSASALASISAKSKRLQLGKEQTLFELCLCDVDYRVAVHKIHSNGKAQLRCVKCIPLKRKRKAQLVKVPNITCRPLYQNPPPSLW